MIEAQANNQVIQSDRSSHLVNLAVAVGAGVRTTTFLISRPSFRAASVPK